MKKDVIKAIAKCFDAEDAEEFLDDIFCKAMMDASSASYCLNCGAEGPSPLEPDAEGVLCEACNTYSVEGLENVAMRLCMLPIDKIEAAMKSKGILRSMIDADK